MAKRGRLELGDNILWTSVYVQPLWHNWPAKQSNPMKKTQNKSYYAKDWKIGLQTVQCGLQYTMKSMEWNGVRSKRWQTKTATKLVWSKWHQVKTATRQNSAKSKRRQKLCVVKLLTKCTMMIYSLCTRLSYLKRRVTDVMCNWLLNSSRTTTTHCSVTSWTPSNMCCINFSLPKVIITTISGRDHTIFPSLMPWTTVTSYLS